MTFFHKVELRGRVRVVETFNCSQMHRKLINTKSQLLKMRRVVFSNPKQLDNINQYAKVLIHIEPPWKDP